MVDVHCVDTVMSLVTRAACRHIELHQIHPQKIRSVQKLENRITARIWRKKIDTWAVVALEFGK